MARDAAFRHFEAARNLDERELALEVIEWTGEQDAALDGAALRPRFAAIRATVDKLPDYQQLPVRQSLAKALAASGLMPEASALAAELPPGYRQDSVRHALASAYARRGNMLEAFAALDAIQDPDRKGLATNGLIHAIASTGKPDIAREAVKFLSPQPASGEIIPAMFALTEQAAGNHEAARNNALAIKSYRDRNSVLFQLLHRYRKLANYPEAVATATLIRNDALKAGDTESAGAALGSLVADLMSMNAHAQVVSLLREESGDDLVQVINGVLFTEDDPGVIREAATRVAAMSPDEKAKREIPLLLARVRSGDLKGQAAVAQVRRPTDIADGLVWVAGQVGNKRKAEAQEILQAAIAANRDRPGTFWRRIALTQAEVGLLAEAHATIDRRISDPNSRGIALIGISGAEAAQGRAAEAARSLDAGTRLLYPTGGGHEDIARLLLEVGHPDAAVVHVLAGLSAGSPGLEYVSYLSTPAKVLSALAKLGDVRRATELAVSISKYQRDTPEPFVDLYCELARVTGPILH